MEDSPTYGTPSPITNRIADSILKKYEDENEHHFHAVDRIWLIAAMEDYSKEMLIKFCDINELTFASGITNFDDGTYGFKRYTSKEVIDNFLSTLPKMHTKNQPHKTNQP